MAESPTHESVLAPTGTRAPRFRPLAADGAMASDAGHVDLNGAWRFKLFPEAVTGADPADRGAEWDEIAVPGHWQLAEAPEAWPYGKPAYTNVIFPIPVDPPRVPRANPTGEYRRTFEVPSQWQGEGGVNGRLVVRFEGVDSWFEVAVNGTVLAQSSGSRLPTEIDVTDAVRLDGENVLAVRVTQWSAHTYVEDQDQWWLSGIFRDVALEHRPEGGIEHVSVSSEYDHLTGEGALTVDVETTASDAVVRIPELGIEIAAGESVRVPVEPWSAEVPRLYDATVSTPAETVALRIGFRTVEIVDGVFQVNGAPVKIYGVNRHEFEPTRGRSVTRETMLQDVLLMKSHHVNSVRTSHYPPHPHFLDLCDEHGLYVVDENDLETHGFELLAEKWQGNPTDDPAWTPVLVDRVQRMVRRDAHHPSIVIWSLGNEAGTGRNLGAMAKAIRELDDSRPLHYEGDWSAEHTDMYSRMYASSQEVALIGTGDEEPLRDAELDARRRSLPFVQCEYVHAMGNGPGGFNDYDALFEAHPRNMGGFVWEWIDHGLLRRAEDGTLFYGYGGDFEEELHDGSFIVDGLLLPDRTPSPGMLEMAAVYAPVRIEPIDTGEELPGIEVRNRYAFRDTSHVRLEWALEVDGEAVATGDLDDQGVLEPGESFVLSAPDMDLNELDGVTPAASVWWTVRAVLREERDALGFAWVEAERVELGAGQVLLRAADPLPAATGRPVQTSDGFTVGPITLDGAGRLQSIGGTPVRLARVDAWRASTDNDGRGEGWTERSDRERWESAGLARLHERLDSVEHDGDALVVTGRAAGAGSDCGFAVRYEWRTVSDTSADLTVRLVPEGTWRDGAVARLGWMLALEQADAAGVGVDWVGLGPAESYADSWRAALTGRYQHSVADLQTHYSVPQENGARRGVTRAHLGLAEGGLLLESGEVSVGAQTVHGFEFSARPWSDAALDRAAHQHEVSPDGALWLHLDAAQHGLGSAACGPGVLPNATLRAAPATIQVRFTLA